MRGLPVGNEIENLNWKRQERACSGTLTQHGLYDIFWGRFYFITLNIERL